MSNVPTWKRKQSEIQYIYDIFLISKHVGRLVHQTARKYRSSYGEKVISLCADAMVEAKKLQNYAITDEQILRKIERIDTCRAIIETCCTTIYIWIEILMDNDSLDEQTRKKLFDREYTIGDLSDRVIRELNDLKFSLVRTIKDQSLLEKAIQYC